MFDSDRPRCESAWVSSTADFEPPWRPEQPQAPPGTPGAELPARSIRIRSSRYGSAHPGTDSFQDVHPGRFPPGFSAARRSLTFGHGPQGCRFSERRASAWDSSESAASQEIVLRLPHSVQRCAGLREAPERSLASASPAGLCSRALLPENPTTSAALGGRGPATARPH